MTKEDKKKGFNNSEINQDVGSRDADFSVLSEELTRSNVGESGNLDISKECDDCEKKLSDLQARYDQLGEELEGAKDKYIRALADLENFRKRAMREKTDLLKYQGEAILFDVLEVVDNLERALAHSESDPTDLKKGLEMIYRNFTDILNKWEVRSETAVGNSFDPVKHSALSRIVVDDASPGTVIAEHKKAYFYKDKLLRHAEVVVSAAGEGQEQSGSGSAATTKGDSTDSDLEG